MPWPFDPLLDALSAIAEGFWHLLGEAFETLFGAGKAALGIGREPPQPPPPGGGGEPKGYADKLVTPLGESTKGAGGQEEGSAFEQWEEKLGLAEAWFKAGVGKDQGLFSWDMLSTIYYASERGGMVDELLWVIMVIGYHFGILGEAVKSPGRLAGYQMNEMLQDGIPDLPTLVQIGIRHPEAQSFLKEMGKKLSYSPAVYELTEEIYRSLLGMGEIRDLYLRGEFGDLQSDEPAARAERDRRLRMLGYNDADIEQLTKLYHWIPPVQDLIRFVIREVYDPAFVSEHYSHHPPPEKFVEEFKKTGATHERATQYWDAHWLLPSIQQGFSMFHRIWQQKLPYGSDATPGSVETFDRDAVGMEKLRFLLKAADILPTYWEDLTKIAYRPFTRVDVRRMERAGVLTPDQVKEAYMDVGFSPWKADKMTEFTLAYNRGRDREFSASQLQKLFIEDAIGLDRYIEGLEALKYTPADVALLVDRANYEKAEKLLEEATETTRDRYAAYVIDLDQARAELLGVGLNELDVNRRLAAWRRDRRKLEKRPSVDELGEWLKTQIISVDDFRQELAEQGYLDRHIDAYVQQHGFEGG